MKTRLIRFNPRRAARGNVGAALVECEQGLVKAQVWLTENDLRKNLALFSDLPPEALQGLHDAVASYRKPWKDVPAK